jgi:hypothetical protein
MPLAPFMQTASGRDFYLATPTADMVDFGDIAEHLSKIARFAGAAYAIGGWTVKNLPPACWPWTRDWWKPQDFRRDLVRAAALILAELERFDGMLRAGAASK